MSFVCKPCNATFALKTNLERHERSDKHAKCAKCLETQPKITEFFLLEAKIAAQDEAILLLSEKVTVLEASTAALQATTASLTEQVIALVQANVQLVHAAEIAELKLAHALELARASRGQSPLGTYVPPSSTATPYARVQASLSPSGASVAAKPRHTGVENNQLLVEKWFNHPRKYTEATDKETGDTKICGVRDLAVKLVKLYKENPDLPVGDNFTRLLDIYKEEVDSKDDNPFTMHTAYFALKACEHVFKWSPEDTEYLNFSFSFESPNHLARHKMTRAEFELGQIYAAKWQPAESSESIRQQLAECLEAKIEEIEKTFEPWETKDKIAAEKDKYEKKLKQMLG